MINVIHVSPVSASFEVVNDSPFYAPEAFDVYVNGQLCKKEDRNVFTVFDLQPDTEYEIKAGEETLKVKTLKVSRIVNVLDHGIENDGSVLVNEKIQKLLDASDNDLIVFPEGKYYCAPLNIRSNTYIYLKKGAEIIGSNNRWDYPIIPAYTEDGKAVNASWEGEPNDSFMSLISSFDSKNIMLVGEGTINGNADKADW